MRFQTMKLHLVRQLLEKVLLLSGLILVVSVSLPETSRAQQLVTDTRMALIVGNSNYNGEKLPNARNDAESIAATLQTLRFDVTLILDATQESFLKKAEEFSQATIRRNANVVLVYYAGHGVQLAGKNYLIPVDSRISDIDTLVSDSIHFDELLKLVGAAAPSRWSSWTPARTTRFRTASRAWKWAWHHRRMSAGF